MTKLCFPVVLVVDSTRFTLTTLFMRIFFSFDCASLTYFTIHSTTVARIVIGECMGVHWCHGDLICMGFHFLTPVLFPKG